MNSNKTHGMKSYTCIESDSISKMLIQVLTRVFDHMTHNLFIPLSMTLT